LAVPGRVEVDVAAGPDAALDDALHAVAKAANPTRAALRSTADRQGRAGLLEDEWLIPSVERSRRVLEGDGMFLKIC
jgi:hypothetical protein